MERVKKLVMEEIETLNKFINEYEERLKTAYNEIDAKIRIQWIIKKEAYESVLRWIEIEEKAD